MDRHRWPVSLTAVSVPRSVDDLAEEPVGRGEDQADGPYRGARSQPAADLAEASELVKSGQETVDAERNQGVDAGELVALAEDGRHLTGQGVERPVVGVGGVAEERQRQNEQLVGERQVPDVVVAHGTGSDLVVLGNDVDDKGVADQTEHEGHQVDGQSYRSNVAVRVSGSVVGKAGRTVG